MTVLAQFDGSEGGRPPTILVLTALLAAVVVFVAWVRAEQARGRRARQAATGPMETIT